MVEKETRRVVEDSLDTIFFFRRPRCGRLQATHFSLPLISTNLRNGRVLAISQSCAKDEPTSFLLLPLAPHYCHTSSQSCATVIWHAHTRKKVILFRIRKTRKQKSHHDDDDDDVVLV